MHWPVRDESCRDRIAIQVEKSVQAIILYLAVVRARAVRLPLNTDYTSQETAYFFTDAEPAVFVCDPARQDQMAPVAKTAKARLLMLDTCTSLARQGPDHHRRL